VRWVLAAVLGVVVLTAATASGARIRGQNFFSNCYFSHIASDDPIVYPRQPGVSHSHTFFGSTTTDASSTTAALRAAPTTCRRSADTAAYWVPTLYAGGKTVRPTKGSAYFVLRARGDMHAFPAGLKIVAGDSHARFPQPRSVVFWSCSGLEGVRFRWTTPRSCVTRPETTSKLRQVDVRKSFVQLDVVFPDCWDGRHLDSLDHHSHMAYGRNWTCPRSHPVKVPRLRFIVTYPMQKPLDLRLASGSILTAHADFFNAWHQAAFERLVADCFYYRPRCNLPPR